MEIAIAFSDTINPISYDCHLHAKRDVAINKPTPEVAREEPVLVNLDIASNQLF